MVNTMPLGRLVNGGRWVLGDSAWSRNSDSYCVPRFNTSFAARDVETSNLLTSANTSPRYPLWLYGMPFFNTKKKNSLTLEASVACSIPTLCSSRHHTT